MQRLRLVLGIAILCAFLGLATFLAGTLATTPDQTARVIPLDGPLSGALRLPPNLTPVLLAALEPDSAASWPQALPLYIRASGTLQPIEGYLPRAGNTQRTLPTPTSPPTPLPYPTERPAEAIVTPIAPTPRPLANSATCAPRGFPVDGILTQRFHIYHEGIDLAVPLGTPVIATHDGIVTFADWDAAGLGYLVILQNGSFSTFYGHNTSFYVRFGDAVQAGSIIAWSGSSGNSSGPHVHYEVRLNDMPLDPLTFDALNFGGCA